ncbi:MAG: hypothetical protein HUJ90_06480 [Bacteroidales bacterium]|nr:hypothetical protein [Bacteroidales bacterium]
MDNHADSLNTPSPHQREWNNLSALRIGQCGITVLDAARYAELRDSDLTDFLLCDGLRMVYYIG